MAESTKRDFTVLDTLRTVLFSVLGGIAFAVTVFLLGVHVVGVSLTGAYQTSVIGFLTVSGILGRFLWSNYYGPNT